ncbi:MAG: phospholipase D-like domain-containing protein, partial [Arsenophonus sp. NC-QC1-MAG3]
TQLIDREITNIQTGKIAAILLKINNLDDKELINRLYDASNAGVKIRLLIRGICSLVPGQPNFSENIQVTSIVDRFLEHDRVYVFSNNGNEEVFISSADWMTRNIDFRIEVAVKLLDEQLKKRVLDILELQFSDTVKARYIDKELTNRYVPRGNKRKIQAQLAVYDYLKLLEHPKKRT